MRKLNPAPQPSVGHLMRAIVMKTPRETDFSSPWLSDADQILWLSRSAWSLEVLARWQMAARKKSRLNIWIPDYFCNATLEPLREIGSNLYFYPTTSNYAVNIQERDTLKDFEKPDIFLHVHYFGFPNRCPKSLAFSKECGALLVEDAAHVLHPTRYIGDFGDCVLYSPHKHLPIPDGAALVVRYNGPSKLGEDVEALSVLRAAYETVLLRGKSNHLKNVSWVCKRLVQKLGYKSKLIVNKSRDAIPSRPRFDLPLPVMSNLSKRLLMILIGSFEWIVSFRQERAIYWKTILPTSIAESFMDSEVGAYSPYLVGFEFNNSSGKRLSVTDLEQKGLSPMTWPDLPPEVLNDQDKYAQAIKMKKNRFFLPVHSSIKFSEIVNAVDGLVDTGANWETRTVDESEWNVLYSKQSMNNLPQSWNYGAAKADSTGWRVLRLVISDENKKAVALVQAWEKTIPFLGSLIRISRGPTMLCCSDSPNHDANYNLAVSELLTFSKQSNWRVVQCSFDTPRSLVIENNFRSLGFYRLKGVAWGSGLIDLDMTETELRQNLNSRWKRVLKKTVKNKVVIKKVEVTDDALNAIISAHEMAQGTKGYSGIESSLVRSLAEHNSDLWNFNIFRAFKENDDGNLVDIGFRVSLRHGNTTTDFLVNVNDLGREFDASSALYWHAILFAKSSGCKWFDIGGLNDATPRGIADFKRGLSANPYLLIGEWRFYRVPKLVHYVLKAVHVGP